MPDSGNWKVPANVALHPPPPASVSPQATPIVGRAGDSDGPGPFVMASSALVGERVVEAALSVQHQQRDVVGRDPQRLAQRVERRHGGGSLLRGFGGPSRIDILVGGGVLAEPGEVGMRIDVEEAVVEPDLRIRRMIGHARSSGAKAASIPRRSIDTPEGGW